MSEQKILVTGGYGCIGAETTKWLLRNTDASVVICSRSVSDERTQRVFHDVDQSQLVVVEADVTSQSLLEKILSDHDISAVVHMAALQTPDCNAYRDLGLQINLAGTQNLIEAIKATGQSFTRFIFASSAAVYGPRSFYPDERITTQAETRPVNVYGAWKLAGEHISRMFHEDTGIPTICLRPGVLYGPGRDAGLTASPTTALKCVALNLPYEIPFRSRQDYLFAPDVGGAVGNTVVEPFDGYGVFNLPSHTLATEEIVAGIRIAVEEMGMHDQFKITIGSDEVPFICDLDFESFIETFPKAPHTPLAGAIRQSMEVYRDQVARGWLSPNDVTN